MKIHWKQFVTLLIEQIQSKHNKNMIILCHNNTVNFILSSRDIRFNKKKSQKRAYGSNEVAQHFFLIGCDMITQKANQTCIFVQIEDLGFPVSREDAYYQF